MNFPQFSPFVILIHVGDTSCNTHVLNNVFNVKIYLVKQMSANLIYVILINVIQNAKANQFFKINYAKATKNIQ